MRVVQAVYSLRNLLTGADWQAGDIINVPGEHRHARRALLKRRVAEVVSAIPVVGERDLSHRALTKPCIAVGRVAATVEPVLIDLDALHYTHRDGRVLLDSHFDIVIGYKNMIRIPTLQLNAIKVRIVAPGRHAVDKIRADGVLAAGDVESIVAVR